MLTMAYGIRPWSVPCHFRLQKGTHERLLCGRSGFSNSNKSQVHHVTFYFMCPLYCKTLVVSSYGKTSEQCAGALLVITVMTKHHCWWLYLSLSLGYHSSKAGLFFQCCPGYLMSLHVSFTSSLQKYCSVSVVYLCTFDQTHTHTCRTQRPSLMSLF